MELQAEIRQSGEPVPARKDVFEFFFSPETARIRVPTDLPAGLAGRIAGFVAEKTKLKAELRDALRSYDEASADARTRVLKQLAASQAPQIAALEERAEDIRQGLASVPNMPGPPAPPPLPDELAARISVYRSHKADLLQVLRAALPRCDRTARRSVPDPADEWPDLHYERRKRFRPECLRRTSRSVTQASNTSRRCPQTAPAPSRAYRGHH